MWCIDHYLYRSQTRGRDNVVLGLGVVATMDRLDRRRGIAFGCTWDRGVDNRIEKTIIFYRVE